VENAGIGTHVDDPAVDFAKMAQSLGVNGEGQCAIRRICGPLSKEASIRQGKTTAIPRGCDRGAALNQQAGIDQRSLQSLRQAVDRAETKIDLGKAALTIAASDYPDLDVRCLPLSH